MDSPWCAVTIAPDGCLRDIHEACRRDDLNLHFYHFYYFTWLFLFLNAFLSVWSEFFRVHFLTSVLFLNLFLSHLRPLSHRVIWTVLYHRHRYVLLKNLFFSKDNCLIFTLGFEFLPIVFLRRLWFPFFCPQRWLLLAACNQWVIL